MNQDIKVKLTFDYPKETPTLWSPRARLCVGGRLGSHSRSPCSWCHGPQVGWKMAGLITAGLLQKESLGPDATGKNSYFTYTAELPLLLPSWLHLFLHSKLLSQPSLPAHCLQCCCSCNPRREEIICFLTEAKQITQPFHLLLWLMCSQHWLLIVASSWIVQSRLIRSRKIHKRLEGARKAVATLIGLAQLPGIQ